MRLLRLPILLLLPLLGCAPPPLKHAVLVVTPNESVADDPPLRASSSASNVVALRASPQEIAAALRFLEAVVELEKTRRAHPDRHEAIFNEAILIQEYGNVIRTKNQELPLVVAIRLYHLFIQQAQGDPDAAEAVRIAKDRLEQIESVTICNFRETEADRKKKEQDEKQRAAEEEVYRQE